MASDDLRYPSLAPMHRETVDDNLQSGLGVIPGEPPSRRVRVVDDQLVSGRGVIP